MVEGTGEPDATVVNFLGLLGEQFESSVTVNTLLLENRWGQTFGTHERIVGLVKSLQAKDYVVTEPLEKTCWSLTGEGLQYAVAGTPEFRFVQWMKENAPEGEDAAALKLRYGSEANVSVGNAAKLGWVQNDKITKKMHLAPCTLEPAFKDVGKLRLEAILNHHKQNQEDTCNSETALLDELKVVDPQNAPLSTLQDLKKRKLVEVKMVKFFRVLKGPKFSLMLPKTITDLTSKILAEGSWRNSELKPYNFFACGKKMKRGSAHPLMLVMKQFKHVLTAMGFEEMPTNQYVESSFWCFDSLFMPQQHPARDVQDTFFLKSPETSCFNAMPKEYVERVQEVHERGGYGSSGWQYDWSLGESMKNIMRTHTTATSARMLFKMAQDYKRTGVFNPKRLFSIDRVFRNETLDATHLAEFHQVEGLVAARGLSLGHLMGTMTAFYSEIGIEKLKFKAAYNPYTEPSMEIFGYHTGLQRWIEVGNSGIFRPEMLRPMGFPEDVSVMAWGLSLERPTMIKFGISNIRQLFGHKASIGVA